LSFRGARLPALRLRQEIVSRIVGEPTTAVERSHDGLLSR
jgi:hypothetical protein